jgi:hypothetical protein
MRLDSKSLPFGLAVFWITWMESVSFEIKRCIIREEACVCNFNSNGTVFSLICWDMAYDPTEFPSLEIQQELKKTLQS